MVNSNNPGLFKVLDHLITLNQNRILEFSYLLDKGLSHRKPKRIDVEKNAKLIDEWALIEESDEIDALHVLFSITESLSHL